jgi:4-hydroxybutyrate CoA-transferase
MSLARLLDQFRPGMRVFVAASSGEPSALLAAWAADPDRTAGLDIFTNIIPGINRFDPETLHPTARISGLFAQSSLGGAQRSNRFRHIPLSYAGYVRDLASQPRFDIVAIQVASPDRKGRSSLGPSVELTTAALAHSAATVALVNVGTPTFSNSSSISLADASTAECDVPLVTYDPGKPDAGARCIACHIAAHIPDDVTLQIGIGKVPAALAEALTDRRGLRIHTGMFGDGMRLLVDCGAVDSSSRMLATSVAGSANLYAWAAQLPGLDVAGCERTHNLTKLASTDGLIAVNSALEVDLFGQCNLETLRGFEISGAGGAPDFARGAKVAARGLSIIALPATAERGAASRIVPELAAPNLVTIPRTDIDLVVTEHGVADLRMASTYERAEALIAIAAPAFRDALANRWSEMARRL